MVAPAVGRVLLVEDDEGTRLSLEHVLHTKGYAVDVSTTCHQALERVSHTAQAPYQAAIIDIALPDGSGLDVLGMVKRLNPETTCLMFARDPARHQTLRQGEDYMVHLFTVTQLLAFMQGSAAGG